MKTAPRRYDSSGRQRDAAQRQARVLDAARVLFLEHGYGATSIDQIATTAETSPQTIYATFGGKPGILSRLLDVAIGGDAEDIRLTDRPEYAEAFAIGDVRERAHEFARLAGEVHRRSGELVALVERVAGSDPAISQLAADLRTGQRTDAERMIDTVPQEMFRRDLSHDQLVDVAHLLGGPLAWYDLVIGRGWTHDEYVTWLSDALWRNLMEEQ